MEVLAGVSSVISVLGLTIQLADGIKKACTLWDSIQDAPHEVQMICKDLHVISNVLDEIQFEENQFMHHSNSMTGALGLCSEVLESLNCLSQKIVPPKGKTTRIIRKWRALKTVIRMEKLQEFQSKLDCAKITLVLARQNSTQRQNWKSHQQIINIMGDMRFKLQERVSTTFETIKRDPSNMNGHLEALKRQARTVACSTENPIMRVGFEKAMNLAISQLSNPGDITENIFPPKKTVVLVGHPDYNCHIISTPFGKVHLRTITVYYTDSTSKMRTTITIHPSRFLQLCGVRFGLSIALSKSPGTIEHALKGYRAVPNNAIIFNLCREGRTGACFALGY